MLEGLVSVIIPTYNRMNQVGKAILSVLAQTYNNHEILVIDDGSIDETAQCIKQNFGSNPKVRYFKKENGGVSSARNFGMREARGEFIALLDSDDEWLPGKLELQLAALRYLEQIGQADIGMVWTDMDAVRDDKIIHTKYLRKMYHTYRFFPTYENVFAGKVSLQNYSIYYGDIFSEMVLGNLVHTSTVLLRKARQENACLFFDERYRTGEDYKFHLKTCRAGPVAFIDVSTVLYRIGESDALSSSSQMLEVARNYLETIKETLSEDSERIELKSQMLNRALADGHNWFGRELMDAGNGLSAFFHFFKSLRYRRLQAEAFKNLLRLLIRTCA